MSSNPQTILQPARTRPVAPGFLQRIAAFLIDIVAVYFAGYTLQFAGERVLLELGPWLPFLSSLGMFCYFWLGNGPLGKGATFGKAVMNIHTVRASDGGALSLVESLRRTALQIPIMLPVTGDLVLELAHVPARFGFFVHQILAVVAATIFFSHIYCVLTHPRRRSWHDFWSGAVVTSDPTPAEFFIEDEPEVAERLRVKAEFSRKLSIFFLILITLLMGGRLAVSFFDWEMRRELKLIDQIEERAPIPGYRLQAIMLPNPGQPETYRRMRESRGLSADDAETSDTPIVMRPGDRDTSPRMLHQPNLYDGHSIIFQYARRSGDATKAETEDPAIQTAIETLRNTLPGIFRAIPVDDKGTPPPELKHLALVFAAPFRFAVLPYQTKRSWAAVGPMDSSQWAIEYNWMDMDVIKDEQARLKREAAAR